LTANPLEPERAPVIDFRLLFATLPTPFMILDRELRFVEMNDAYLAVTSRTRDELIGQYVFDAFPEVSDRLALFKGAFERALAGEANVLHETMFRILRPESEGGGFKEIYWDCSHAPVRDTSGRVCWVVQHARDITSEVEAKRLNDVMSAELDHRVKNMLTIVASVGRRTAQQSGTIEQFLKSFNARLGAMARTHSLLARANWTGATLQALIDDELAPYRNEGSYAIVTSGPPIRLGLKDAQVLSMAFHELVTNAAKYGALSKASGRLLVMWRHTGGDGSYAIEWREEGLSGISAPAKEGFGSVIVTNVVPIQLEARVSRDFRDTGLVLEIAVPKSKQQDLPGDGLPGEALPGGRGHGGRGPGANME
jgi:PAS domain S-box-containing protein